VEPITKEVDVNVMSHFGSPLHEYHRGCDDVVVSALVSKSEAEGSRFESQLGHGFFLPPPVHPSVMGT